MTKRKAMFGARATGKGRKKARSVKRAPAMKASLAKQVRQLVQGARKETDQDISVADLFGTHSVSLTSNSVLAPYATSYSTTSLATKVLTDHDQLQIESVRIKGHYSIYNNVAPNVPVTIRQLLVWFKVPPTPPVSSGQLPLITDVLVSDDLDAMELPENVRKSRFSILSDKTYALGVKTAADSLMIGPYIRHIDERIRVNKSMKFILAGQSGQVGHYDSDSQTGQSKQLLILFVLTEGGTDATLGVAKCDLQTRLTYIG